MKLNKEKFLQTELGTNLIECVKAWDKALDEINRYAYNPHCGTEYRRANKVVEWCQAQWEVYQLMFKQFYNIDCHFSKTADNTEIVTNDHEVLFNFKREV